jgi:mRNA interferase MazF
MDSTERPRRGEIWLVSFGASRRGEPGKNRPAIVVSVDDLLVGAEHELIAVVPLSSSLPPSGLRPRLGPEVGIDADSAAVPRAIRGVARRRLLRRLGEASVDTLAEVEAALAIILGIHRAAASPT